MLEQKKTYFSPLISRKRNFLYFIFILFVSFYCQVMGAWSTNKEKKGIKTAFNSFFNCFQQFVIQLEVTVNLRLVGLCAQLVDKPERPTVEGFAKP